MTATAFVSLVLFSVAMSITPGPNNLLLTMSGLTYGFRQTLPAIMGSLVGMAMLFLISGAGVGALILGDPRLQIGLRILAALYLVWLAWRLWQSGELAEAETRPPLRLWHVAGFQFVNPKAWMMTVSAVSIYVAAAEDYGARLLLVAATFLIISAPCVAIWVAFGAAMKSALKNPYRLKLFNRAMAALTVLSAVLVLLWA